MRDMRRIARWTLLLVVVLGPMTASPAPAATFVYELLDRPQQR